MANSPSKVGREGAATETPNEQARNSVLEPIYTALMEALGRRLAAQFSSEQMGNIGFVLVQLQVINEAGSFSSGVLNTDFERFFEEHNRPFPGLCTLISEGTFFEHAIIAKLYKILIKKQAEKQRLEARIRNELGLDQGDTHVDNTVSTAGVMKLVVDAIQSALDAKLEEDTTTCWPPAGWVQEDWVGLMSTKTPLPPHPLVTELPGASDANETSLPSHEENHDSNEKLSPSQIQRVEKYKSDVHKLLAQVWALDSTLRYAIAEIPEAQRSKALRKHERVRAWLEERLFKGLAMDEEETWHYLEEQSVPQKLPFFFASAHSWHQLAHRFCYLAVDERPEIFAVDYTSCLLAKSRAWSTNSEADQPGSLDTYLNAWKKLLG